MSASVRCLLCAIRYEYSNLDLDIWVSLYARIKIQLCCGIVCLSACLSSVSPSVITGFHAKVTKPQTYYNPGTDYAWDCICLELHLGSEGQRSRSQGIMPSFSVLLFLVVYCHWYSSVHCGFPLHWKWICTLYCN